jgi:hypothetical protein
MKAIQTTRRRRRRSQRGRTKQRWTSLSAPEASDALTKAMRTPVLDASATPTVRFAAPSPLRRAQCTAMRGAPRRAPREGRTRQPCFAASAHAPLSAFAPSCASTRVRCCTRSGHGPPRDERTVCRTRWILHCVWPSRVARTAEGGTGAQRARCRDEETRARTGARARPWARRRQEIVPPRSLFFYHTLIHFRHTIVRA